MHYEYIYSLFPELCQQKGLTLNEHQLQAVKLLREGRYVLCGSYVWQPGLDAH